jgi:hypothetical protein
VKTLVWCLSEKLFVFSKPQFIGRDFARRASGAAEPPVRRTGSRKTTNRSYRVPSLSRQGGGHEPHHETFRIDWNSAAIEILYEPHCRSSGPFDEIKTRCLLAPQP